MQISQSTTTAIGTATPPALDDATRSFVKRSMSAGLVELDDLKKVVVSLLTESSQFSPQRLADGLIGAGILTQWQGAKLLAGKSKGFYLGSYRLLRPLGRGGMGVVYLGEHHMMKRLMALKILPPGASADPRRIKRFQEEAKACAQLDHPNIVRAYDFSEAGGKLYIVMEYVDGIDLHHAVIRDGRMSISEAMDVLAQAASGLAHAHERGIIHRDIKPSNLMLRTDGVVKVSDLGLARIGWIDGEDESRRLMGTADFVAPEQAINSKSADARADIYSLGCTFYFLLTGRPPFAASSVVQRLARHQTTPVPDVRVIRPDCPASVAELLQRMMAKRPADRPKSAVELIAQLKRIGNFESDHRHAALQRIAPAGDDAVDDATYQATIDDSSLSSDGEIEMADEVAEFDFDSLPAIDLSRVAISKPLGLATAGLSHCSSSDAARDGGRNLGRGGNRAGQGGRRHAANSREGSGNQQVLLGIGLTLAFLALAAVVGMGVMSFSQPMPKTLPKIKATEEGKIVYLQ